MSKEFWDESFSQEGYVYGKDANQFVQEHSSRLPKNSHIGCFAEGEGRNGVYLAKLGHHVTILDQSEAGLNKSRELADEVGVQVESVQCDLTTEKIQPNQFDAAVMVFGHVPKQDQPFLIEQMLQSVKPGGVILLEVYSEEQLSYGTGGPPAKEMLYAPEDVLSWIKPYKCLHFFYGEAERNEGERHNGLGHVIQVMVQK
ncbi:methyltransferase domain-containing protein [Pontibacillus yanchengensis]|uniref:Methyltransferase domain-containing protein n=1 Tax=Pontibacillus yanchengensis TaxID=462910 RepID=A0A6I5A6C9_9BACI|nr:class I SAM-dependent methyltransferase [Pontibacillus yanchengensis]MYL35782.1 methyltransferase domain-containing protein [Pontibacillus yanchengensis]